MTILITGATGFIGSELRSYLTGQHRRILRLVRRTPIAPDEVQWDPTTGTLDPEALEGVESVVHLAGENLASGRWTSAKKRRIRESRVEGTRLLSQALARLFDPPKVMISVSAVGYYGDRGDELLDERSEAGSGFLPELCREWESATEAALMRGIRVVIPRLGMVMSGKGGALSQMLPFFRNGMGGRIGSGAQYISWIALPDLIGVIDHALRSSSLQGPINAVSPHPVTNAEFTEILARILSRRAPFALPAIAARIVFGEMAREALLASARVAPMRTIASGYTFIFPELESALRHALERPLS